jgi:hypothetical protein
MKLPPCLLPLLAASALILTSAPAGEFFTLVAENAVDTVAFSSSITLVKGDTAELKYVNDSRGSGAMVVSTEGKEFNLAPTFVDKRVVPIVVAGPATIKMRSGFDLSGLPAGVLSQAGRVFATIEVTRAGMASNAATIPQEAGTTWQVILEASTDMVNWTPVPPRDYPSASPQRFFRTRLVKRQ